MRRPVIAGNWKMFKTSPGDAGFFRRVDPADSGCRALRHRCCAAIHRSCRRSRGSRRNACRDLRSGCLLGKGGRIHGRSFGPRCCWMRAVAYTIIGHSERRQFFGETDETVNKKTRAAIAGGLQAIVCVGETLAERDAGKAVRGGPPAGSRMDWLN